MSMAIMAIRLLILGTFGSQADFGLRVGQADTVVSNVLHRRRVLRQDDAERWAKALRCSKEDLAELTRPLFRLRKAGGLGGSRDIVSEG